MSDEYEPAPHHGQRLVGAERARWLIHGYYTDLLGEEIRHETPRTMRCKIEALETRLRQIRQRPSLEFQVLARQISLYTRIGELLEMMPTFR